MPILSVLGMEGGLVYFTHVSIMIAVRDLLTGSSLLCSQVHGTKEMDSSTGVARHWDLADVCWFLVDLHCLQYFFIVVVAVILNEDSDALLL